MACPYAGASGSCAARRRDGQGTSAAASSHQAHAYVGDDPIIDEEEEALEHAGCTITTQILHTPCRGPSFVSELVSFDGNLSVMREP